MNMLKDWLASMKVLGLVLAVVTGSLSLITPASAETKLTLQSFNIHGGDQLDDVAKIIASLKTDIAGIQEVRAESDPCEADFCPPFGPSVAEALAKKTRLLCLRAKNRELGLVGWCDHFPLSDWQGDQE